MYLGARTQRLSQQVYPESEATAQSLDVRTLCLIGILSVRQTVLCVVGNCRELHTCHSIGSWVSIHENCSVARYELESISQAWSTSLHILKMVQLGAISFMSWMATKSLLLLPGKRRAFYWLADSVHAGVTCCAAYHSKVGESMVLVENWRNSLEYFSCVKARSLRDGATYGMIVGK